MRPLGRYLPLKVKWEIWTMYLHTVVNKKWMSITVYKAWKHHNAQTPISLSKNFSRYYVLIMDYMRDCKVICCPCSFTLLAESLFQVRRQLEKLDELLTRLTYDGDPIPVQRPQLMEKVNFLLYNLFRKCVSYCEFMLLYSNWHTFIGNNET